MNNIAPIVEIRGLTKKFKNKTAIDGIDLDIYRGECLGLVGESGCGKTTAGKAIIRLHYPTSGNVFYNYRHNGTAEGMLPHAARVHNAMLELEGLDHGARYDDVADLMYPEVGDRMRDGCDVPAQSVEGGVEYPEHLGGDRRIPAPRHPRRGRRTCSPPRVRALLREERR